MRFSRVLLLAAVSALALAVIPELLPSGPSVGIDPTKFLASGRILVAIAVIFLGGLGTSLTPCVYPLIPITVGVFGARKAESRAKAVVLTTSYVVGMGVVFSTLGVIAALSGKAFGSALGSNWVALGLAVFMVILASSMFGAFELALPSGLTTRLNTVGGSGLFGAFLMGSVSGFLAAPCTGPVLTGVLAFVGQTRDPVLGAGLLFVYALGIGVPFFLIGVFSMQLPKSGEWMEWVKSGFGIALLALAAMYLRDGFSTLRHVLVHTVDLLGKPKVIGITATLVFIGVLAGAVHFSFKAGGRQFAFKALAVLLVAGAIVLRVQHGTLAFWALEYKAEVVKTLVPFEEALANAKADCRPVLIDFGAEWCAACKELETITYKDQRVLDASERFVRVKVDGTEDHALLETLYGRFGVKGLPTVAFVGADGDVLADPKVTGFLDAPKFVDELAKVGLACSR